MDHEKERTSRKNGNLVAVISGIGTMAIAFYVIHILTDFSVARKLGIATIAGLIDWMAMRWFIDLIAKNKQS